MRTYRTSGPFLERPFYTSQDIEQLCDEELRRVDLLPLKPCPIRIERFIEKRFHFTPTYEELPEGVLGFIEFGTNGAKSITISSSLAEEDNVVAERRVRTTLAHEGGHALLHAHLFAFAEKIETLFGKEVNTAQPRILCRNTSVEGVHGFKKTGNPWWEIQANLVIGPILAPRLLVFDALEPFLVESGLLGNKVLDEKRREEAIRSVAQIFDVNPIVAKIRINHIFPMGQINQLTL